MRDVVVVGASLAGVHAAEALRARGYEERLRIVGAEDVLPYDRPPLSKGVLQGKLAPELTAMRTLAEYEALGIELVLGRAASRLDPGARSLELADGEVLTYDGLVIATGVEPRQLPGRSGGDGLHVLRTLGEATTLAEACARAERVVVVGGGFIGLEVAAGCRLRGLAVTVVEALAAPLAAALGPEMGSMLSTLHAEQGVALRCGAAVASVEGGADVEAVVLDSGERVDADLVVVGIGTRPATGWLQGSGLALNDGVVCDATCAAGPGIVAAGDVARWPSALAGRPVRVEHWTNGVEQGFAAAGRLLGTLAPYDPVPYVWSDQYDDTLHIYGHVEAGGRWVLARGSVASRDLVALQDVDGRLAAVVAINEGRAARQLVGLISRRAQIEDARCALR